MFSGAVTSSPVKRKLRSDFLHSPDESFLSPDSSYFLDSSSDSAPCCYRRSPRLLTNGYYHVSQGSFTWDESGNVSLATDGTSVCYKENLVRIFKRRRRPHNALVSLLHDVKDNCQSWLGVFRTNQCQDVSLDLGQDLSPDQSPARSPHRVHWDLDQTQETDLDWSRTEETLWTKLNSTELEDKPDFVYDPTEAPPPPDKLILDQTSPDICQSQDTFSQSVGGLSEVPPTLYSKACHCQSPEQKTGLTLRIFLLFFFTLFIMAAVYSRCLWWSSAVVSALFLSVSTFMMMTKSGPMGQWRKAKTEDITSRNE